MSRTPGAQRGHVWTKAENDVLRAWADNGYTVREMVALSADYFGETINDASLRNHLNYLGINFKHERRKTAVTEEMKAWMRDHYRIGAGDLTKMFNARFETDMTVRQVYKLSYRIADEQSRALFTKDKFYTEWEAAAKRISPDGRIKKKHWLWRYYPLDENRGPEGVVFRGRK